MRNKKQGRTAASPKSLVKWVLLAVVAVLSACTKDGNTIYVIDEPEVDNLPIIYFVSREGSLGDQGYVDAIYRGVVKGASNVNARFSAVTIPSDTSLIDPIFTLFLNTVTETNSKALAVIDNDAMEPLMYRHKDLLAKLGENTQILLIESSDTLLPVNTIRIPQYGVCYQAGRVAARSFENEFSDVVIANANRTNELIAEMREGFTAGIEDGIDRDDPQGDKTITNIYFSDESGGFDMADSAYHVAMDKFVGESVLLFPLCGGTTQGFLRYSRDSNSFWILGVDVDMQQYSQSLPFSVVKCIDKIVEEWIGKWVRGDKISQHQVFGLGSGYTKIVVSDRYSDWLPQDDVDDFYQLALEKETEYENNKK